MHKNTVTVSFVIHWSLWYANLCLILFTCWVPSNFIGYVTCKTCFKLGSGKASKLNIEFCSWLYICNRIGAFGKFRTIKFVGLSLSRNNSEIFMTLIKRKNKILYLQFQTVGLCSVVRVNLAYWHIALVKSVLGKTRFDIQLKSESS